MPFCSFGLIINRLPLVILFAALLLSQPSYKLAAEPTPTLLIAKPSVLQTVERGIGGFASRLGARGSTKPNNRSLWKNSAGYRDIVDSLSRDLEAIKAADPLLSVTMAKSHRLFDKRWLRSPAATFELAGIVNRIDRRPFHAGTCGELRFIYRLKYATLWRGSQVASRLPFTVNIVYWIHEGPDGADCGSVARRWRFPTGTTDVELAGWLISDKGPLAPAFLDARRLKSVEINLQSVRWPSTVRPDLGAHAEYLLRVFKSGETPGRFTLAKLENTPDVRRIRSDSRLRRALLEWLRTPANLTMIDQGIATLPERFLARKATSVAPLGLSRLANRPFAQIFSADDFSGIDFSKGRYVRSAEAFLRRLDDLSCAGCHQARSVAGFHLLGVDRADTDPVNAIAVSGSPHLLGDQPRRKAFVRAIARGEMPDSARPFSDRPDEDRGDYGSHCGLGDEGFAHWTCGKGLRCQPLGAPKGDMTVGQCFPSGKAQVGDPCEPGWLRVNTHPHRDRLVASKRLACAGHQVCEATRVGFPGGMCAGSCGTAGRAATCGSIALLNGFNRCLARREPFARCITENVRPAGLRRCDDETPCRDDYLCARTASGTGACIPPYFLFQMRVDGHPRPPLN